MRFNRASGSAMAVLTSLTKFRADQANVMESFLDKVRRRRAEINPDTIRQALGNRRMVRCLNADGEVLTDMEDVEKRGPVVQFQLTPRARRWLPDVEPIAQDQDLPRHGRGHLDLPAISSGGRNTARGWGTHGRTVIRRGTPQPGQRDP